MYALLVLNSSTAPIEQWFSLNKHRDAPFRIFFYKEGVYHAAQSSGIWQTIRYHWPSTELICCVGAVERRGIHVDESQSLFTLGGLGLLAECISRCDEVIEID